jgi:hypothetical protein
VRIFKHKYFLKWAHLEGLEDEVLRKAVDEMESGLYEANLGGGLYKKRVMRKGQGKRGAYRTLIAFKKEDRAFFVYGFGKNERDNVGEKELIVYKQLAKYYLNLSDNDFKKLTKNGDLVEVLK